MATFYVEKIARVTKNKKRLEEFLRVKITVEGREVTIEGEGDKAYLAEQVIEALDLGFPYSQALTLAKEEDVMLHKVNLKEYSNQKNMERVRGRIIGTQGKALRTIGNLTECYLEIKENTVGIIGDAERVRTAEEAITSIAKGTKHANVYKFLEKAKPAPTIDLKLKGRDGEEETLQQ